MMIYFNNDGSCGHGAVNIPVLVNGKPIGFVSEVTEEKVICYLWDRLYQVNEQDIRSININNDLKT